MQRQLLRKSKGVSLFSFFFVHGDLDWAGIHFSGGGGKQRRWVLYMMAKKDLPSSHYAFLQFLNSLLVFSPGLIALLTLPLPPLPVFSEINNIRLQACLSAVWISPWFRALLSKFCTIYLIWFMLPNGVQARSAATPRIKCNTLHVTIGSSNSLWNTTPYRAPLEVAYTQLPGHLATAVCRWWIINICTLILRTAGTHHHVCSSLRAWESAGDFVTSRHYCDMICKTQILQGCCAGYA